MCASAYRRRGVQKSAMRYVRTKWMTLNECFGIFFCIVSAKYTRASPPARKMSLFSCIILRLFCPMRQLEFSLLLNSNLHKNSHSIFLKEIADKCLFKIPLWRDNDNTSFYFLISNKTFSKIIGGRVTFLWRI